MQTATVSKGAAHSGITVTNAGTPAYIAVGEKGRGRTLTRAPLPEGATVEDGRLIAVPGDGAVVVLFCDHSGFRGGWRLRCPLDPERVDQAASDKAALAPLVAAADAAREAYRGAAYGDADATAMIAAGDALERAAAEALASRKARWPEVVGPDAVVKVGGMVIAEGRCAQGDAGAMGGGPEFLCRLPVGAVLEILRTGRLYGAPGHLRVTVGADGVTVVDVEAETAAKKAAVAW